jgi:subtilisin family serine protease
MYVTPTHRVVNDTPYYETGPQQGRPADGTLEAGALVQMVREAGSYSQVEREDGTRVYVSTQDLQPITKAKGRGANKGESQYNTGGRAAKAGGDRVSPPGSDAGDISSMEGSDHLDEVALRYGEHDLPLTKSTKFLAIKPRAGISPSVLAEMVPQSAMVDVPSSRLGGFQLINADEAGLQVEETLDTLRASEAISTGTHVYHTSDDEVPFVPTGQIYIEFAPEASWEECQDLLEQHGLEIVETRGEREIIAQVTAASLNPIKTANALQGSPQIRVAEPDLGTPGMLHAFTLPTDDRLIDQWHLRNVGTHRGTSLGFLAGADARVIEAWEVAQSAGSPNVVVAIIDDGFDLAHPDLSGTWKIVAPKDFTRNSASPVPDTLLEDWHGTACAGVAVGNADGTGIVGAAPRCRLMPVRWGRDLSDREIENWFGYVREQGAWVVSCSWGAVAKRFVLSTRASRAIERCAREGRDGLGTVICFAAGNENRDINDPLTASINGFAIHPDVIAVAASTSRDKKSHYSNFGERIAICAPSSGAGGWGITTSDVMGQYTRGSQTFEAGYSPGAYTNDFGGTSSACPLVAGICALILSIQPDLTASEVRQLIEGTARKIGDPASYDANGHSILFGHGCVNAVAAVAGLRDEQSGVEIAPLWGDKGHKLTNQLAINAVPGELRNFYNIHLDTIVQHAMDADHAKGTDPSERPRHFIDIDLYGEFPFTELPEDFEAAVRKFGRQTIEGRGIVPWQIERTYQELVHAFGEQDLDGVLRHSAWLGHYVGDSHVPFHTTANHDGQLTGQKGLHSYFETRLLNKHISPEEIKPPEGKRIVERPHSLAFRWVRESYAFVQPLLDADAANGGKTRKRNLAGFAKVAKPIAVDRLAKGSSRIASLWFSAWIEAGKPSLSELIEHGVETEPEEVPVG